MNITDKFKFVMDNCKCGFYTTINKHRDYYQTAEEFIKEQEENFDLCIPASVRAGMIDKNQVVEIRAYTKTPVGSFVIYHYDLEMALDDMIDAINIENDHANALTRGQQ